MATAIVWLRQDLRLSDNPALYHAVQDGYDIVPTYIWDDTIYPLGGAQRWWLHHSLKSLGNDCKRHRCKLLLRQGKALDMLVKLIQQHKISAVYWNRCYEPKFIKRDKFIKETLENKNIICQNFKASSG